MVYSQIVTSIRPLSRKNHKSWQRFCQNAWFWRQNFQSKLEIYTKLKKRTPSSVFGYENKEKHPIYVLKKMLWRKTFDLLLIGEEGRKHYVLIKDFNTFMYDHTLHCGRNIFAVIVY